MPLKYGEQKCNYLYLSLIMYLPLSHTPHSSLPSAWLETNSSSTSDSSLVVHLRPESLWVPNLRTLKLRGNSLNTTAYAALQTVIGLQSLQTLDLGENSLTGSIEDALTLYYCIGTGRVGCGDRATGVGGALLRVIALDGNELTGAYMYEKRSDKRMYAIAPGHIAYGVRFTPGGNDTTLCAGCVRKSCVPCWRLC